jgi:hypothetical protein
MRFLSDPTITPGRVEVRRDGGILAMAPVGALALIDYAMTVGDETRAHPETMPGVRAWLENRHGSAT